MTGNGYFQLCLYLIVLIGLAWPLGLYMAAIYRGDLPVLLYWLRPMEEGLYRFCGIKSDDDMPWSRYAIAMLAFNLLGFLAVYALQRFQVWLPLNPEGLAAVTPDSSFNTAVSFATNTNWQGYGGETTMSYLSQMLGLAVQNFVSAATGIAVLFALFRGIARRSARTIGNFWVDLTRTTLYILLPLSIVLALALASQGVVQSFGHYSSVSLQEPATIQVPVTDPSGQPLKDALGAQVTKAQVVTEQTVPLGPAASQVAIKQLGTNGGGIFNANSAHPFENPGPWTNLLQIVSMNTLGYACVVAFGRIVLARREARALVGVMAVFVLAAASAIYAAETHGNPALAALGVDAPTAMEGKETRFGLSASVTWAVLTTAASNGSVNAMHDSLTPVAGAVAMLLMQLGEVVFGGVGSGLYGMVLFVLVTVFVSGLMVGRTPEYLCKKIGPYEMKMTAIALLAPSAMVLLGTATAVSFASTRAAAPNPGPHGFSEILYAFSSAAGNNGSAFAGLTANTLFYTTGLGLAMLIGRFLMIVPMMAMAGALASKKLVPASAGTFPTTGGLFVGLLVGVILIVGGLTFFPALSLGPIVEYFMMAVGKTF